MKYMPTIKNCDTTGKTINYIARAFDDTRFASFIEGYGFTPEEAEADLKKRIALTASV